MDGKERYAIARPRHHEIYNILKMKWIVRTDLIVNILCQRREDEFCILLITYAMNMPHVLEK
jgi:hypothetical protein